MWSIQPYICDHSSLQYSVITAQVLTSVPLYDIYLTQYDKHPEFAVLNDAISVQGFFMACCEGKTTSLRGKEFQNVSCNIAIF